MNYCKKSAQVSKNEDILSAEKSNNVIVLLILLGVLVALLLWLLLSPIVLQVDTRHNEYVLYWGTLANASLVPQKDDLLLRLRLPFWRKDFSMIRLLVKPTKNKQTRTREAPPKQKSKWRFSWTRFRRILKSFRVQYFRLELDTDDYVTNAYLYPLCHFLNTPTRSITINFQGRSQCAFRIQNRLARVLIAFIF